MLSFPFYILIILLVILLFVLYLFLNTMRVQFEVIEATFANLPPEFEGFKLLQISDMHMEMNYVSNKRVTDFIAREKPDLLVITGDTAETLKGVYKAKKFMRNWSAKEGMLAVFGNHEYSCRRHIREELLNVYQECGIQLLRNESVQVKRGKNSIQVVGVDDFCTSHEDVEKSFSNCKQKMFTILLGHDPNVADVLPDSCAEYALGGHFHGGQLHVPGIFRWHRMGDLPLRGISRGSHHIRGIRWYISRGMGQVGIPFRYNALPEVTLHILKSNSETYT